MHKRSNLWDAKRGWKMYWDDRTKFTSFLHNTIQRPVLFLTISNSNSEFHLKRSQNLQFVLLFHILISKMICWTICFLFIYKVLKFVLKTISSTQTAIERWWPQVVTLIYMFSWYTLSGNIFHYFVFFFP